MAPACNALGSQIRSEPTTAARTAGSPPPPRGRHWKHPLPWPGAARPSGGHIGGGGCKIGEEIGPSPPSPVSSDTTWFDGKLSNRGEGMSEVEACHGATSSLVLPSHTASADRCAYSVGYGICSRPGATAPAGTDGEHRLGIQDKSLQAAWIRFKVGRSRKTFVPVAMERHRGTGALPNRWRQIEYSNCYATDNR